MRGSRLTMALAAVGLLALAACGNAAAAADTDDAARCLPEAADCDDTPASGTCPVGTPDCNDTAPPAMGMCLEGATDCVDTVDTEDTGDGFDEQVERDTAQAMLGLAESDLGPDVRVGRRGGEQMMLTEDYVLGRKTVELDVDADGVFRVTSVTVELLDGPETFTA